MASREALHAHSAKHAANICYFCEIPSPDAHGARSIGSMRTHKPTNRTHMLATKALDVRVYDC